LLPEARQWVDRLRAHGTTKLLYPVSNLQREFRLGYARACALADRLAQRGEWTVAYDEGGTRYARIHRMA
jgi:DNA segregation ATPase FtsK/SpoIIIE-like protein